MKIKELLEVNKSENKYDVAIRMCWLIFCSIGFIVFFAVGLQYMVLDIWLLAFVCCVFGAIVLGVISKTLINMIRKDRQKDKKVKADLLKRLLYIFIFAMATIAFITIGIEESGGDIKYWIVALVGSYGGAVIASALVRMIITFLRKDN